METNEAATDHTTTDVEDEVDVDWVMEELDTPARRLPEVAIRIVQKHPELFIPRLIECLEAATETALSGDKPVGKAHFFALFLLTEFRAFEAWPAIHKAISLPGEAPSDLFEGAVTSVLAKALAVFCADSPQVLDELIANPSHYEYVRWTAACTYLLLVRDGRLTRHEAVDRLRFHLRDFVEKGDSIGATFIVTELYEYASQEALEDIREAYRLGKIDEGTIFLEEFEESAEQGDELFRKSLSNCWPIGGNDPDLDIVPASELPRGGSGCRLVYRRDGYWRIDDIRPNGGTDAVPIFRRQLGGTSLGDARAGHERRHLDRIWRSLSRNGAQWDSLSPA